MKIACLQMNMKLGCPNENFAHAAALIEQAMDARPDVLVLPETWNTGFFPRENLAALCDEDGRRVKEELGGLAAKYGVNLVAGSVSNRRNGRIYNTALVFDRSGACIASYDKTHLFSPMGEQLSYTPGDHLCRFSLDGAACGLIICYDLRFPELTRTLAVPGMDLLFVVSQWPSGRIAHLRCLTTARAIENQMFVACCNSCGTAGDTVFGGNSALIDPWGEPIAQAGTQEQILIGECRLDIRNTIQRSIPVFRDRRPDLYHMN